MAKTAYAILIIRKLEGSPEERSFAINPQTGKRFETRARGQAAVEALKLSLTARANNDWVEHSVVKVRTV